MSNFIYMAIRTIQWHSNKCIIKIYDMNKPPVYIPSLFSQLYKKVCGFQHLRSAVPPCVQNAVIAALSSKSWDVETATELLLSNWKPIQVWGSQTPSIRLHPLLPGALPPLPFIARHSPRESEPSSSLGVAIDLTAVATANSHQPVACLTPSAFNIQSFPPPG